MLELVAELVAQGAQLRSIQRQIVDFERVENCRHRFAAEAVGGIDDDLRVDMGGCGADVVPVNTGDKALDITGRGVGGIVDLPDLVEEGATEIFARKAAFDGAFGSPALMNGLKYKHPPTPGFPVEGSQSGPPNPRNALL